MAARSIVLMDWRMEHGDCLDLLPSIPDGSLDAILEDRCLHLHPSGYTVRHGRTKATVLERGGSTPLNVLPIALGGQRNEAGHYGHGAGTPYRLCEWWVRYICPPGGTVLDPFAGAA